MTDQAQGVRVACHRLHTSDGKARWMWVDGAPSPQAEDDSRNFGWTLERCITLTDHAAALADKDAQLDRYHVAMNTAAVDEWHERLAAERTAREAAEASVRELTGVLREAKPYLDDHNDKSAGYDAWPSDELCDLRDRIDALIGGEGATTDVERLVYDKAVACVEGGME